MAKKKTDEPKVYKEHPSAAASAPSSRRHSYPQNPSLSVHSFSLAVYVSL